MYTHKKIALYGKSNCIREKRNLLLISFSIMLNLESCSSICRNVKIWKLYIIKEFLDIWWFQDISAVKPDKWVYKTLAAHQKKKKLWKLIVEKSKIMEADSWEKQSRNKKKKNESDCSRYWLHITLWHVYVKINGAHILV